MDALFASIRNHSSQYKTSDQLNHNHVDEDNQSISSNVTRNQNGFVFQPSPNKNKNHMESNDKPDSLPYEDGMKSNRMVFAPPPPPPYQIPQEPFKIKSKDSPRSFSNQIDIDDDRTVARNGSVDQWTRSYSNGTSGRVTPPPGLETGKLTHHAGDRAPISTMGMRNVSENIPRDELQRAAVSRGSVVSSYSNNGLENTKCLQNIMSELEQIRSTIKGDANLSEKTMLDQANARIGNLEDELRDARQLSSALQTEKALLEQQLETERNLRIELDKEVTLRAREHTEMKNELNRIAERTEASNESMYIEEIRELRRKLAQAKKDNIKVLNTLTNVIGGRDKLMAMLHYKNNSNQKPVSTHDLCTNSDPRKRNSGVHKSPLDESNLKTNQHKNTPSPRRFGLSPNDERVQQMRASMNQTRVHEKRVAMFKTP